MKKINKNIVYCLLTAFIISNTFFSYSFADSNENKCPACNSTPNEMQMYINFEVEMLGILRGVSEKEQVFGTNKNSWLFNGGGLSLSNAFYESTMAKIKTDFDSEFRAVRAANTTAVLLEKMALEGLDDSMGAIQILFKDESFVRDYKLLQELDMTMNDVIRDMGTLGIWKDEVSPSIRKEILQLQVNYSKTYGGITPIFETLTISSSVKNRELLSFLLKLNATMKSMLLAIGEDTPVLDTYISYLETATDSLTNGNIKVKINEEYTKSIVDAYSCAKTSICNSSFKNAIKELADLSKIGDSFSNSKNTILNAIENLKAAIGSRKNYDGVGGRAVKRQKTDGIGLTDRQIELLHTVYGIDAYSLTTSQIDTWKQNFAQFKKEIEPVTEIFQNSNGETKSNGNNSNNSSNSSNSSSTNKKSNGFTYESQKKVDVKESVSAGETIKDAIVILITQPREPLADGFKRLLGVGESDEKKLANNLSEEEKRERLDTIFWQEVRPESEKNVLWANTMQITIDKILVDKSKDKEYVMIGQNRDTHYFVEIGAYIHSIVKDVIGDKGTDGLIKNLGEACTYQCSNHGTDNCYAK